MKGVLDAAWSVLRAFWRGSLLLLFCVLVVASTVVYVRVAWALLTVGWDGARVSLFSAYEHGANPFKAMPRVTWTKIIYTELGRFAAILVLWLANRKLIRELVRDAKTLWPPKDELPGLKR